MRSRWTSEWVVGWAGWASGRWKNLQPKWSFVPNMMCAARKIGIIFHPACSCRKVGDARARPQNAALTTSFEFAFDRAREQGRPGTPLVNSGANTAHSTPNPMSALSHFARGGNAHYRNQLERWNSRLFCFLRASKQILCTGR